MGPHYPHILIIVEEDILRDFLKRALTGIAEGCQVLSPSNGFPVLAQFRQESLDLVIVDYDIAGLDGLDLSWIIRTIYPATPIVLLSHWYPANFGRTDSPEEFDGFLQKPFSLAQLFSVVKPLITSGRGNLC